MNKAKYLMKLKSEQQMLCIPGKGQLVAVGRMPLLLWLCCWLHGKHFLVRKEVKMALAAPCLCCDVVALRTAGLAWARLTA